MKHIPVLLSEVLETLGDVRGKTITDCTFGAGGYSRALLERGARVIAFDRDPTTIPVAKKFKQEFGDKFTFINEPFSNIANHSPLGGSRSEATMGGFDAIVFDIGISSMQIDTPERGFSWRFDAPLDMRMNQESGIRNQEPASKLLDKKTVSEITEILRKYGDVKKANIIARAIKNAMPKTTFELRDLIHNPKDVAPVFQAIRIAVNDEMGELETALAAVPDLLSAGGKCLAVTFHSLEDRIVKNTFREWTTVPGVAHLPTVAEAPFRAMKTHRPGAHELENNPRARSAHLRAVEKL